MTLRHRRTEVTRYSVGDSIELSDELLTRSVCANGARTVDGASAPRMVQIDCPSGEYTNAN